MQPEERTPAGNYASLNWEALAIKYYLAFPISIVFAIFFSFLGFMYRIAFPLVDHLMYTTIVGVTVAILMLFFRSRNTKLGKAGTLITLAASIGISGYLFGYYLPGAVDFPLLLTFLGIWCGFSLFIAIIFLRSWVLKRLGKSPLVTVPANPARRNGRSQRKKRAAFVLILLGAGGVVAYCYTSPGVTVQIRPQDYQVNLSLWGWWNQSRYTSPQLQEISDHRAAMFLYNVYYESHLDPAAPYYQDFNDSMTVYKSYGIPIYFGIGLRNGTLPRWQNYGCLINASYLYFTWLDAHPEFDPQHGGNFMGVCNDIEGPQELVEVNRTEYLAIAAAYAACIDAYHARGLTYSQDSGTYTLVDGFDGINDTDLDERNGLVNNGIPNFDFYSWQVYRGRGESGSDPDYRTSYLVYADVAQAAAFWGNRSFIYLGITGMSTHHCGTGTGTGVGDAAEGLQALITDCLVCKHFGIPWVGIFILTYWDTSVGGADKCSSRVDAIEFFEAYGQNALHKLDEAINGPGSTQPFEIDVTNEWYAFYDDFLIDLFLNFNGWLFWVFVAAWSGVCGLDLILLNRKNSQKVIK